MDDGRELYVNNQLVASEKIPVSAKRKGIAFTALAIGTFLISLILGLSNQSDSARAASHDAGFLHSPTQLVPFCSTPKIYLPLIVRGGVSQPQAITSYRPESPFQVYCVDHIYPDGRGGFVLTGTAMIRYTGDDPGLGDISAIYHRSGGGEISPDNITMDPVANTISIDFPKTQGLMGGYLGLNVAGSSFETGIFNMPDKLGPDIRLTWNNPYGGDLPYGREITGTVVITDPSGVMSSTTTIDGAPILIGETGVVSYTADLPGSLPVRIDATDVVSNTSATTSTLVTVNYSPTVDISGPYTVAIGSQLNVPDIASAINNDLKEVGAIGLSHGSTLNGTTLYIRCDGASHHDQYHVGITAEDELGATGTGGTNVNCVDRTTPQWDGSQYYEVGPVSSTQIGAGATEPLTNTIPSNISVLQHEWVNGLEITTTIPYNLLSVPGTDPFVLVNPIPLLGYNSVIKYTTVFHGSITDIAGNQIGVDRTITEIWGPDPYWIGYRYDQIGINEVPTWSGVVTLLLKVG